jgi:RNA polymerase sigma-70 factor (ECF subfamily)
MGFFGKRKDRFDQIILHLRGYGLNQLRGKDMLIEYFASSLYHSLDRKIDYADFEDIFMDTINDFVKSIHNPAIEIQNYEGYFRKIFRNKVAHFRMIQYDEQYSRKEYQTMLLAQTGETGFDEELLEKLYAHIDQLPQQCKNLILMKFYESKSHKEIAQLLQITVESSKVQLARCKKRLLQKILTKNP